MKKSNSGSFIDKQKRNRHIGGGISVAVLAGTAGVVWHLTHRGPGGSGFMSIAFVIAAVAGLVFAINAMMPRRTGGKKRRR